MGAKILHLKNFAPQNFALKFLRDSAPDTNLNLIFIFKWKKIFASRKKLHFTCINFQE